MRLFKIKNKYMFKSNNPNGNHTYAVYKDRKTNKYRAIQLTHLYEDKKVKQINKGYLKIEKFKQFTYPTGVHNTYYDKDVKGKSLYFGKNTKHLKIGYVPDKQAKRIRNFANKNEH